MKNKMLYIIAGILVGGNALANSSALDVYNDPASKLPVSVTVETVFINFNDPSCDLKNRYQVETHLVSPDSSFSYQLTDASQMQCWPAYYITSATATNGVTTNYNDPVGTSEGAPCGGGPGTASNLTVNSQGKTFCANGAGAKKAK